MAISLPFSPRGENLSGHSRERLGSGQEPTVGSLCTTVHPRDWLVNVDGLGASNVSAQGDGDREEERCGDGVTKEDWGDSQAGS